MLFLPWHVGKNRLPYDLYCVGGDVKHCSIQSNWHVSLCQRSSSESEAALTVYCDVGTCWR